MVSLRKRIPIVEFRIPNFPSFWINYWFLRKIVDVWNSRLVIRKVWTFWEGHKIWKNLPFSIWRYSVVSNFKWKIFSNFLSFSGGPNFTFHWKMKTKEFLPNRKLKLFNFSFHIIICTYIGIFTGKVFPININHIHV